MKYLILLVTFFGVSAFGKSELECLKELCVKTGYTEESITRILMECNNQFLIGQTIFLNNNKVSDKMIRKFYPRNDEYIDMVTEVEKGRRLLNYNKCEEISRNFKLYISSCEKE